MIGNRVSTATILFTDLVASTELRASMGEVAADRFSADHERMLTELVEQCGGRVVKGEGDGAMAAFAAASDAVQAAVEIQRAVAMQDRWGQLPGSLAARIGLGAGDVTFTDDDCRGMPVVEAARLEAAAGTNEILCTDLVRLLTGGRGGHDFESVGPMDLKGIPDPVPVSRVLWTHQAGIVPPVPSSLANLAWGPFVGRESELQALREAWERADGAASQLVTVVGEPGAGKSRLIAEFADEIAEDGALVLFGRCDPGSGVPYQPLAEALTPEGDSDPRNAMMDRRPELARLIGATVAVEAAGTESDPESRRYKLFTEVTGAITQLSAASPTLLVLDDLHWAAEPTLAMLRHIVAHADGGRLLVCVARRHIPGSSELLELEQHLARTGAASPIELGALSPDDITDLATRTGIDATTAGHVFELSGGNALLAGEVLRGIADGTFGSSADLPPSVHAAVATRTARLADDQRRFLEAAAVCGHRFEPWLVGMVANLEHEPLLNAIDVALEERLVAEVATQPPAYEFNHALLRLAFEQDLSSARAKTLHRRAAEALIARHGADYGPTASKAAAHAEASGERDDLVLAARLRIAAAGFSSVRLAPEDAVAHLEAGLVDVGPVDGTDLELRFDLLLALAWAQVGMLDGPRAADAAIEASKVADQLKSDHHLARVGTVSVPESGGLDGRFPALTDRSLAAARRLGDTRLEARVLAENVRQHKTDDAALRRAREAIAVAEVEDDPVVLARSLLSTCVVISGSHHAEEGQQNATRILELIAQNPEFAAEYWPLDIAGAHDYLCDFCLARCDLQSFEHHLQLFSERVARYPAPNLRGFLALTRGEFALLQGRFNDYRGLQDEIESSIPAPLAVRPATQRFWYEYELGRLGDMAALMAGVVRREPDDLAFRAALSLIQAESGDSEGASETLAWDTFTVPKHGYGAPGWPLIQHCLAVCAYRLRDQALARRTLSTLAPHRDLVMRVPGTLAVGAAARSLGLCHLILGEADDAVTDLEHALTLEEGLGAVPHTVRTRVALANALDVADREPARAHALRAAAYDDATSLGMTAVIDELDTTPQN